MNKKKNSPRNKVNSGEIDFFGLQKPPKSSSPRPNYEFWLPETYEIINKITHHKRSNISFNVLEDMSFISGYPNSFIAKENNNEETSDFRSTYLFEIEYLDTKGKISEEQTKRVLEIEAKQDDEPDPELEAEAKIWRAAQTLLKSYSVYVPYADKLVDVFPFPTNKPRVRRDFKRFLALIKTHCLLYQFQREKDERRRLLATIDDLKAILPLTEVVLSQSLKEYSPKQEKVLVAIETNFKDEKFSLKSLMKKLKLL